MRILVTNDDGIYASGLWVLVEELRKVAEVVVVAPDREQSGVGTSVTLLRPIRLSRVLPMVEGVETYAVQGSPADCVILALGSLFKDGIDLVMAGINQGANLGYDAFISGTVGAALQGYFQGKPSIALSITTLRDPQWSAAAPLGRLLAAEVAAQHLPRNLLLNVNLPNLSLEGVKGVEVTRLGGRSYADIVEEREDERGKHFHWIVRGKPDWDLEEGTDIWAVRNDRISVTPLHCDITNYSLMPQLQGLKASLVNGLRPKGHISPRK